MSATLRSRSSSERLELPRRLVGGLVRAGRVARAVRGRAGRPPRRATAACSARRRSPRRGLLDEQAAGEHDERAVAQVAADERRATGASRSRSAAVVADGLRSALIGVLDSASASRWPWRARPSDGGFADGLVLLDPGEDRGGELLRVGVGCGELLERRRAGSRARRPAFPIKPEVGLVDRRRRCSRAGPRRCSRSARRRCRGTRSAAPRP